MLNFCLTCTAIFYRKGIIHISLSSIKTDIYHLQYFFLFCMWRSWLLGNVTVTLNTISMTVHTLENDLSQFINGDIMQRSLASIKLKQSCTQEGASSLLARPAARHPSRESGRLPPTLPSHVLLTSMKSCCALFCHVFVFPE